MKLINFFFKIIFDYSFSLFLIIILFPVQLIIAVLIYLIDGLPIFFSQTRAGKNGKAFKLIKFRTILTIKNKKYISPFGRFLRITRLDEIPQVYNIILGQISFVGPRPLYLKYIKLYNKHQIKRLNLKPGITGWAQINGDNNISWKKKFKLDIWYINNFNFLLDLKIIFLTGIFLIQKIFNYSSLNKKKIIDREFNGKN
jgi:lipopolysaccharide/colanic/teichoic acid biosynthesis glycosyltransferase